MLREFGERSSKRSGGRYVRDLDFDPSRSPEVEPEGAIGKATGDFL